MPARFFMDIVDGRRTMEEWIDFGASLGLDAVDCGQAGSRDRSHGRLAT